MGFDKPRDGSGSVSVVAIQRAESPGAEVGSRYGRGESDPMLPRSSPAIRTIRTRGNIARGVAAVGLPECGDGQSRRGGGVPVRWASGGRTRGSASFHATKLEGRPGTRGAHGMPVSALRLVAQVVHSNESSSGSVRVKLSRVAQAAASPASFLALSGHISITWIR